MAALETKYIIVTPSGYIVEATCSVDAAKKAKNYMESLVDYGYHDLTIQKIVKTEMVL